MQIAIERKVMSMFGVTLDFSKGNALASAGTVGQDDEDAKSNDETTPEKKTTSEE